MRTLCLFFFLFIHYQCLANIILQNEVILDNVLKNVFETCRKEKNPGMQVVVVRGGQTLFKKAYGVKDKNKPEKMDLETLVGVGTLTKSMANLLVLESIQQFPQVEITTALRKLFGEPRMFSLSYLRSKYATPLDVMTNRMGFPKHNYLRLNRTFEREGITRSFAYMKPEARFRDSYIHNNVLFSIIIHMAERLGGDDWEILAKENLFTPIGMKNADFLTTFKPKKANVATPYVEHYGRLHPVSFKFLRMWEKLCSGCVLASANDMAEYMQFIVKGGKVKLVNGTTVQLIPKSDMNDFQKPWIRMLSPSVNQHFTVDTGLPYSRRHYAYGLGLKTGVYRGHRILEESGDSMGHSTIMTIFPDTRLGIYIALSGEDKDDYFRTTLSSYISDLYHQEMPWLNTSSLCTFPRPFRLPVPEPPDTPIPDNVELDRKPIEYIGDYYNKLYGFVRIRVGRKGKLVLGYGPVVFDLKQKKPNSLRFYMVGKGDAEHTITNARMKFREEKFQLDPTSPVPPRLQKRIKRPIDRLVVYKFDRTVFKRMNAPLDTKKPGSIPAQPKKPVQKKPNIHKKPPVKKPQPHKKPGIHKRPPMHKKPKPPQRPKKPQPHKKPGMHKRPQMHKKPKPPMHKRPKPPIRRKPNPPPKRKQPKPNMPKKRNMPPKRKPNMPKKPNKPGGKPPKGVPIRLG